MLLQMALFHFSFFSFLWLSNTPLNIHTISLGSSANGHLRFFVSFCFSWSCCTACGILVPQPRIEPRPRQ